MKSKSLILFLLSSLIFVGTILYLIVVITLDRQFNPTLMGAILVLALLTSVGGLVVGLVEITASRNVKNWAGLIGNLIIGALIVFLAFIER